MFALNTEPVFYSSLNMTKKNDKHLRKRSTKVPAEARKARRGSTKDAASSSIWSNPAYVVVFMLPIVVTTAFLYWYRMIQLKEMIRQPLNQPLIVSEHEQDMSRYWGSYRSNLYFGLKTRHPKSPVVGK